MIVKKVIPEPITPPPVIQIELTEQEALQLRAYLGNIDHSEVRKNILLSYYHQVNVEDTVNFLSNLREGLYPYANMAYRKRVKYSESNH